MPTRDVLRGLVIIVVPCMVNELILWYSIVVTANCMGLH